MKEIFKFIFVLVSDSILITVRFFHRCRKGKHACTRGNRKHVLGARHFRFDKSSSPWPLAAAIRDNGIVMNCPSVGSPLFAKLNIIPLLEGVAYMTPCGVWYNKGEIIGVVVTVELLLVEVPLVLLPFDEPPPPPPPAEPKLETVDDPCTGVFVDVDLPSEDGVTEVDEVVLLLEVLDDKVRFCPDDVTVCEAVGFDDCAMMGDVVVEMRSSCSWSPHSPSLLSPDESTVDMFSSWNKTNKASVTPHLILKMRDEYFNSDYYWFATCAPNMKKKVSEEFSDGIWNKKPPNVQCQCFSRNYEDMKMKTRLLWNR